MNIYKSGISVIVPVYNGEKYIRNCIDSLCYQTISNIEIIIVDDGSTDATPSIIDEYAKNNINVNVIHQENKGPMHATITGVKNSKYDIIGFVDADDYVEPFMFQEMINVMKHKDVDCVRCAIHIQNHNGLYDVFPKVQGDYILEKKDIDDMLSEYWENEPDLYQRWSNTRWDKIWKKDLFLRAISMYSTDNSMGEDLLLNLTYLPMCTSIAFINKPLYYLSYNPNSLTHGYNSNKIKEFNLLVNELNVLRIQQNREGKSIEKLKNDLYCWCVTLYLNTIGHLKDKIHCLKEVHKIDDKIVVYDERYNFMKSTINLINSNHMLLAVFSYRVNQFINKLHSKFTI